MDHGPVAVGVDGPGGSGKTTFTQELAEVLSAETYIVHGDDFYSDTPERIKASLSPEEGYEQYFDWRRLNAEVLTSIRSNADTLRYQRYDWDRETLGEWIQVAMPEVIIVEGVYMLRPELRAAFDVTVLLKASTATRMNRQTLRGENSRLWIDRWTAAEDFYLAEKGPWNWVDYVVESE